MSPRAPSAIKSTTPYTGKHYGRMLFAPPLAFGKLRTLVTRRFLPTLCYLLHRENIHLMCSKISNNRNGLLVLRRAAYLLRWRPHGPSNTPYIPKGNQQNKDVTSCDMICNCSSCKREARKGNYSAPVRKTGTLPCEVDKVHRWKVSDTSTLYPPQSKLSVPYDRYTH
jgi:hypothetical protein